MTGEVGRTSTRAKARRAAASTLQEPAARERILRAAETLFADRGFDRTSTASIAVAAGVPSGLVFYHFKTKMALLLAVVSNAEARGHEVNLPPVRTDGDLRAAITALWRHLAATMATPSAARKIVIQELSAHPEVRRRALELQAGIADAVAERLARAAGHDGPPLPDHVAAASLLTMTAAMASVLDEPAASLVDADAVAALIEAGLRNPT